MIYSLHNHHIGFYIYMMHALFLLEGATACCLLPPQKTKGTHSALTEGERSIVVAAVNNVHYRGRSCHSDEQTNAVPALSVDLLFQRCKREVRLESRWVVSYPQRLYTNRNIHTSNDSQGTHFSTNLKRQTSCSSFHTREVRLESGWVVGCPQRLRI